MTLYQALATCRYPLGGRIRFAIRSNAGVRLVAMRLDKREVIIYALGEGAGALTGLDRQALARCTDWESTSLYLGQIRLPDETLPGPACRTPEGVEVEG